MVTTSNQQDGASSSSPPDPPTQPEQQPAVADNSNSTSTSPPSDPAAEVASPLTHPAPLPVEPPVTNSDPSWKRPPPKVAIKIYPVSVGAVVSWHARLTQNHEEIAKYQLYSYQEGSYPPSTSLWKKLGDIDPLPLPMACTLSQFSAGYTYHFAIRAVDIHGRSGKFSESLSMFMEEDKIADELLVKEERAAEIGSEEDVATKTDSKDSNGEEMESVQDKEGKCVVSEEKDSEEDSVGLPRDPVTPVKEVEKTVGCGKESEKAVEQCKEQDKETAQGKDQDLAKTQAKDQDKETVLVKEEKDRSPCSC